MSGRTEGFFNDDTPMADEQPPPPRAPAPARVRPVRAVALAAIVLLAVVVGLADRTIHQSPTPPTPFLAVAAVPPPGVESSAWYCAGGTASTSTFTTTIDLVNTTTQPAKGLMRVVGSNGKTATRPVVVPGLDQIVETPGPLVGGDFVAATIEFQGGGVLATEGVAGSTGWSETTCSRSTATQWYFASGATQKGDDLTLSLYNPTTTEAVIDTTFVTPSGISQPQLFQGIVVAPGALAIEHIDAYVQDAASVSSIIDVRTGAVVAAELQTESVSGSSGVSVQVGVPMPASAWVMPRSIDVEGGVTSISVFNPTQSTDRVVVVVRPGISPPARFSQVIGPMSTWVLETSGQTRIPLGLPFLATVRVDAGPGVVVDRSVHAPSSAPAPQFGATTALAVGTAAPVAVLSGPGTELRPVLTGATVDALNMVNTGSERLRATVWALDGGAGRVQLATIDLAPGATISIGRQILSRVGRAPIEVSSDHPLSVLEDLAPSASAGVVSLIGAGAASG